MPPRNPSTGTGSATSFVHRDYLISAPIRLFIFDDRIEIISPGRLPNNLTVEKIRSGNSNIRNPILVSYTAKGLLPYRGLGSGIKRALAEWKPIDFHNDEEGCLFTATIHREQVRSTVKSTVESTVKTPDRIIELMKQTPSITVDEISESLELSKSAIEKQLSKLKAADQDPQNRSRQRRPLGSRESKALNPKFKVQNPSSLD